VFGVGDDVREAPGTDREDLSGFFGGVAERVQAGTSLGTEDEVARSQLLFAVLVPEDGTTAQNEEHLFGSEMHMHPHLRRVGGQFVQRCSHPGVVRPPEDSMPGPGFFVLAVPCVGEEVLTIHSWYLRVVAVDAQPPKPPQYGPRPHCAGNARRLAAPNRYPAGSTAGSCLLESADDGTAFAKDHPDQVADARAAVCDQGLSLRQCSGMKPDGYCERQL
jgi:hypothetical protein